MGTKVLSQEEVFFCDAGDVSDATLPAFGRRDHLSGGLPIPPDEADRPLKLPK